MNWYYAHNGEQKGPIFEDELKQLVASGKISADDLVWRDGMGDWASYESVFGAEPSAPESTSPPVVLPASGGTGGQTPNSELRARALKALAGRWGPSVGITFLMVIMQQVMGFIPLFGLIAGLIITGPLMLGFHEYFLRLNRDAQPLVSNLFNGFSQFVLGLGLYVLVTIIVLFSCLVAAIPGGILVGVIGMQGVEGSPENNPLFWVGIALIIIPVMVVSVFMYLRYSLVYFIALDEPEKGVLETLKKSPQILQGHKSKLFSLFLVFFGWSLLTVFTLFIGLLWVAPYMYTSFAAFYDDLSEGVAAESSAEPSLIS